MDAFFQKYPGLFRWSKPTAGCIAFPSLREDAGLDAYQFCEELVQATGVLLLPGSCFDPQAYPRHFRISFARSNMSEGLGLLEGFVETRWPDHSQNKKAALT